MAALPRHASGDVVFVGIDSRSLRAAGTWPWPREAYGQMITQLFDLGASEIFLDIDFSAPSSSKSDEAFSNALSNADGTVILPIFRQAAGVGAAVDDFVINKPLEVFSENAWVGAVNLRADPDGRIRRLPWGIEFDGTEIPSAVSILSGVFGPTNETFPIDYSIMPSTVPTYSALALIEGELTREQIMGRSVIIGGHASEFSDAFSVPVHGTVDGVILQVLATETLIQGTVLTPIRGVLSIFVVLGLTIASLLSPIGRSPVLLSISFFITSLLIEVMAASIQSRLSLLIDTPVVHGMLATIAAIVWIRGYGQGQSRLSVAKGETRDSLNILQKITSDSSDAVILTDQHGNVLGANTRGYELFVPSDGSSTAIILPKKLISVIVDTIQSDISGDLDNDRSGEMILQRTNGGIHLKYSVASTGQYELGTSGGSKLDQVACCITIQDVSLTKDQQARLDKAARFDPLTETLRHQEFISRLASRITVCEQSVFVLNLHRFKVANRNLGRTIGNEILRGFTSRLGLTDDRILDLARLGGDVIAFRCDGSDEVEALELAEKILIEFSEPFVVHDVAIRLPIRVGIAFGAVGEDASVTLEHAELAMDKAREVVGEGIRIFEPESIVGQERYRRIEHALWTALQNDEMYVFYQPQVTADDGMIIGAEALVRWTHPELGVVSPGEFIPIAESNGFIEKLGAWVLDRACRDAASWPSELSIAVNVSSVQFKRGNIQEDVRRALDASGLEAARLQLEITESLFVEDSKSVLATLYEFKKLGIVLALDDFGSGFSSFSYLASLPIDKLKLDRSFVLNLGSDIPKLAIVKSVISLAQDLALQFICEGVETEDQCDRLLKMGCPQIQGYLFGRPMSVEDFLFTIGKAALTFRPIVKAV